MTGISGAHRVSAHSGHELIVTAETRPFFEAAARGVLLLGHCADCGSFHYYPRPFCPHCFSDSVDMREAGGWGTIYSFSVVRNVETPYCVAYVALDEGVTLLTNIVRCDIEALGIGQSVRLVTDPDAGDVALPLFTQAGRPG